MSLDGWAFEGRCYTDADTWVSAYMSKYMLADASPIPGTTSSSLIAVKQFSAMSYSVTSGVLSYSPAWQVKYGNNSTSSNTLSLSVSSAQAPRCDSSLMASQLLEKQIFDIPSTGDATLVFSVGFLAPMTICLMAYAVRLILDRLK